MTASFPRGRQGPGRSKRPPARAPVAWTLGGHGYADEPAAVALFLEAESPLSEGPDPLLDSDEVIHLVLEHSNVVRRSFAPFVVRDSLGNVLVPGRQVDVGRVTPATARAPSRRHPRVARPSYRRSELAKRIGRQKARRGSDRHHVCNTRVSHGAIVVDLDRIRGTPSEARARPRQSNERVLHRRRDDGGAAIESLVSVRRAAGEGREGQKESRT
jgi:hypothetical protein